MDIDIYALKMHETKDITGNWSAMRVPGGWIYTNLIVNMHNTADPNNAYYTNNYESIFVPITQQSKEEQMEGLLNP